MSTTSLEQAAPAVVYDDALRFTIPSRSKAHETHMVDLGAYDCNGQCDCIHFATKMEPLLRRQITAAQAIEQGLLKTKRCTTQHPEDVLRCYHIVDARRQFATLACRAITTASKLTKANVDPSF